MKEIVERVLEEERASASAVDEARRQADEIVRQARAEAARLVELATSQATEEAQKRLEECRRALEAERESELAALSATLNAKWDERRSRLASLVEAVFASIINLDSQA